MRRRSREDQALADRGLLNPCVLPDDSKEKERKVSQANLPIIQMDVSQTRQRSASEVYDLLFGDESSDGANKLASPDKAGGAATVDLFADNQTKTDDDFLIGADIEGRVADMIGEITVDVKPVPPGSPRRARASAPASDMSSRLRIMSSMNIAGSGAKKAIAERKNSITAAEKPKKNKSIVCEDVMLGLFIPPHKQKAHNSSIAAAEEAAGYKKGQSPLAKRLIADQSKAPKVVDKPKPSAGSSSKKGSVTDKTYLEHRIKYLENVTK
jgi:hypothetical protein